MQFTPVTPLKTCTSQVPYSELTKNQVLDIYKRGFHLKKIFRFSHFIML